MGRVKTWFSIATDAAYCAIFVGAAVVWLMRNLGGLAYRVVGDQHYVIIAHRVVASSATYFAWSRAIVMTEVYLLPFGLSLVLVRAFLTRHDKPTSTGVARPGETGFGKFIRRAAIPLPTVAESTEINCMVEDVVPRSFRLDDRKWGVDGRHLHLTHHD